MVLFLILLMITLLFHLNLKKKLTGKTGDDGANNGKMNVNEC